MPIDFELSEAQKLLQKSAREFALKEFTRERAVEYESKGEFPWDIYRRYARQGYIGITWPEEHGGQGLTPLDNVIAAYEFCRVDPVMGMAMTSGVFGANIIANFGTPEQKAKWLPRLARGEITSAGCFTEPAGGSDISRVLDTRAAKDGSGWVLNGAKTFITNVTTATVFLTLTQTDTQARPPHRGQTVFLIERCPGLGSSVLKGKMGFHISPAGELSFANVRLAAQDIVGGQPNLNRGFYLAISFIDEGRLNVGNRSVATAEAALDKSIAYASERSAFGRKIGGFQGIAHQLADMATRIEMAKSLRLRSAWLFTKAMDDPSLKQESVKLASMLKWYGARLAVESCDLLVDIYGGSGYFAEEDVSRWYKFAKMLELVEGTKEVQKNAISRIMLGNEITGTFQAHRRQLT